jgi:hypothetical protein
MYRAFARGSLGVDYTVRRRYLPGTNVLQTTFVSTAGTVRVTDALVTGIAGRLPWAQLVRRIESLEGEVRMRWAIRPGTRLGTAAPWVVRHDGAHLMRVGATTLAVLGEEIGRVHSEQDADPFPMIRGTFLARVGSGICSPSSPPTTSRCTFPIPRRSTTAWSAPSPAGGRGRVSSRTRDPGRMPCSAARSP